MMTARAATAQQLIRYDYSRVKVSLDRTDEDEHTANQT
jgi:hypothetical protein